MWSGRGPARAESLASERKLDLDGEIWPQHLGRVDEYPETEKPRPYSLSSNKHACTIFRTATLPVTVQQAHLTTHYKRLLSVGRARLVPGAAQPR